MLHQKENLHPKKNRFSHLYLIRKGGCVNNELMFFALLRKLIASLMEIIELGQVSLYD